MSSRYFSRLSPKQCNDFLRMSMKLKLEKRLQGTKGALAKLRREGDIPGVLYVKSKDGVPIVIKGDEFRNHLRHVTPGCLSTQIFTLDLGGKTTKAIVKDIQYERVSYNIEHVDLMELHDKDAVSLYIPIICKGEDSCPGVSQGGQLKRVKRSIRVSVVAKEIPDAFVLDVTRLNLGEALRVRDLPLTPSMKVGMKPNQALVTVNK